MKIFKAGETIAREGETSREIFLLQAGTIAVYKGKVKLEEYSEKGIVFGEMSAILGEPRSATIVAQETTTVTVLDGNVEKLLRQHPEIAKKILITLTERLKKMTNEFQLLAHLEK